MVDLLESCPPFQRGQVMGCLADLALNANVIPYLRIWKSDVNGRSFASLLLQFWADAEAARLFSAPAGVAAETSEAGSVTAFDRLRRALKASKVCIVCYHKPLMFSPYAHVRMHAL